MKKVVLAVGALGAMVFAAACSSGGGGGAHGSFSDGTYDIANGAFAGDGCNLASLGQDPTSLNATGIPMTITGNTMDFGGLILTGGGATWVFTTSQTGALDNSGACVGVVSQTDTLAAAGTDKGTFTEAIKVTKDSSSTGDCSDAPVPVPCTTKVKADVTKE